MTVPLILFLILWSPPNWMVHSFNVVATVADVESTQHCLHAGTCREGNPLMSSKRAGAYAVSLSLTGIETVFSENQRKHGHKYWWIVPLLGGSIHTGAAFSNAVRFH